MNEDKFENIAVGDEAEIIHKISASDLKTFAALTGDDNPLHMDESYAALTSFKKRVAHGMLTASFISTMIGTKLPGKGALWYEQQLRFLAPARIGEKIRIWAKVKHKSLSQRILTIETLVFGDGGRQLIEGEAKVKVLKPEKKKNQHLEVKDKSAVIITGASCGIGAAIANELALSGYPVVVNYAKSTRQAEDVVRHIKAQKGKAVAFQANVSDTDSVKTMADFAIEEYGAIAGVVNNASSSIEHLDFSQLSWDTFQNHIDVQIKGAFNLCQAVLPHFVEAQRGVIINIASIFTDNVPPIKLMPYTMAKAALVSFSRSLAVEYGTKAIRVNCVSPGMTQTDLIADVPEKAKMVAKMQTPLRRLATPEDTAGVVSFLFSDKAKHVTGENIRVCGGTVMM